MVLFVVILGYVWMLSASDRTCGIGVALIRLIKEEINLQS